MKANLIICFEPIIKTTGAQTEGLRSKQVNYKDVIMQFKSIFLCWVNMPLALTSYFHVALKQAGISAFSSNLSSTPELWVSIATCLTAGENPEHHNRLDRNRSTPLGSPPHRQQQQQKCSPLMQNKNITNGFGCKSAVRFILKRETECLSAVCKVGNGAEKQH